MFAFVQYGEGRFAHIHVGIKSASKKNEIKLGRQWLVVWKSPANRANRHFTVDNLDRVPRRE